MANGKTGIGNHLRASWTASVSEMDLGIQEVRIGVVDFVGMVAGWRFEPSSVASGGAEWIAHGSSPFPPSVLVHIVRS